MERIALEEVANFYPVSIRKMRKEDILAAAMIDDRGEFDHWDVYAIHRAVNAKSMLKFVAFSPDSEKKKTVDGYLLVQLKIGAVEIKRICTRRKVRRRRVASQLFRTALEQIRKGDFRHSCVYMAVHEQNEEGLRFAAKHGFVRVGSIHGKFEDYDYGPERRDAWWFEQRKGKSS